MQDVRSDANGLMTRLRKMFAQPAAGPAERPGLGGRELQPERQCANGETLAIRRSAPVTATAALPTVPVEVVKGSTIPLGYRAASGPQAAAVKK